MAQDRVFVVVMGADQRGIIARISGLLFENDCNIIDVQQKVMDGTFVMTLLAEVDESHMDATSLRKALDALAADMGLTIMLQSEAVIQAMHRV